MDTIDKTAEAAVKKAMNYHDGSTCCKVCQSFVPDDCSGSAHAKAKHCVRNAFDLSVSETGMCNHFKFK